MTVSRHDSDIVDLTLLRWHQTDAAILVSETEEGKAKAVWLPLSQIEVRELRRDTCGGMIVEVSCPEWLATKKGLV